ncbi:G-protein coupled receptor 22 [Denticeps clupeoides]|uniref:G-protein coupled receptor 22 n=1 Tax=Denticeps clupeoides TaxID=299321 RepID=A0AAY4D258_9TELE|nr:G-protein coupled receptor 22-like [Denticeps clupeoides]
MVQRTTPWPGKTRPPMAPYQEYSTVAESELGRNRSVEGRRGEAEHAGLSRHAVWSWPSRTLLRGGPTRRRGRMHTPPALPLQATMSNNVTVLDDTEALDHDMDPAQPYPVSFQASLTVFLMLEIVLGLSSNLTVLVLYCMKSNLVSSVSNIVTMNLHVLDVLVCLACIPLTIVVVLLPLHGDTALVCCFHEACVSFASVATAANVLAITLDRYDISVRPANRVLTMGRVVALLGSIWALSFLSFLVPFMEVGFFSQGGGLEKNQTLEVVHTNQYYTELGLYYHLLAQIPIFFFTAVVMLVTYYKILQALNIRIGTRFHAAPKKKLRAKKTISMTSTQPESTDASQSSAARNPPLAMRTSVSVIIALRRAVKRHRERRERQKRVFRMSLLIISTFLLCWTPITVLNTVILSTGPSDFTVRLRLGFLVMAYGTTIFHPLLYAFTRQKFQKVLKSKMKKRVVSVVEAEPMPNNVVIHNSWIDPKRNKKVTFEETEVRQKCLSSEDVE